MDDFSIFALSFENVSKCINKIKSITISKFGIKSTHFNCLMHIDMYTDGLTPTEISKDCGVDKALVSRTTADLIKGGFIQTNQKFNDGRKYRNKYVLTEKGREVIKETKAMIEKYFSDLTDRISEYDMSCFMRVILAVSESATRKKSESEI